MKSKTVLLSAVSAVAISARVLVGAAVGVAFIPATVAQAASFRSIDVRGNQRVEAQTIRDYIGIKPGQNYTANDLDEAIKRLYSTGLFSDVSVNQSGGTLVITVTENLVINQVLFSGNKKIKDAALSGGVQLKSGSALDNNTLEQDAENIREAYRGLAGLM